MDKLLCKLKELNLKGLINTPEVLQLVLDIENLAEEVLITNAGYCNWTYIDMLKDEGFDVYAIETDSWGWLLACIKLPCGRKVYYG